MGSLECIVGSMYSGKSEELIRRVNRARYAHQKVIVFKHSIDNRYDDLQVVSHNKNTIDAIPVSTIQEMWEVLNDVDDVKVVGIEEIQFFNGDVVEFVEDLIEYNIRVIVAGLDLDFKREPFNNVNILMAKADKVDKLRAICVKCGSEANFSQRLIDGKPASKDSLIVLVGATECYEARCRDCYEEGK